MSRAARFLVLACSLILALPQSWCCVFASQLDRITAGTAPTQRQVCCECQTGTVPAAPERKPSNLPPDRCPCSDRQTVLPHSPAVAKGSVDVAIVAILPVPDASPTFIGMDAEAVCVIHPPTCHRHVLKCVWRC